MKTKRVLTVVGVLAGVCLLAAMLIMPVSGAATTAVQNGCFPVHQVQADETAESIAQIYNITVADLLMANELASAEDIYAGQELCIPTVETTEPGALIVTTAPTETVAIEAAPVTTETLAIEAAPVTTETLAIEAAPVTTETLAIEAAPVTTETLATEAAPVTTEGLAIKLPPGTPTRICVEGQVIDKSHHGIAGLTVTAQLGQSPGQTAKTDDDGYFTFTNLRPGNWVFRVAVPDSWKIVTPEEISVELAYGHKGCYQIRFKLDPRGCVIVKKTDAAGRPLGGWPIRVSDRVDPREGRTGANGEALFKELMPGTYVVSEAVPYPWEALTPAEVTVQVKPAWSDDDCSVVTFQNQRKPTTCVIGTKVDDNHKPLAGWTIYAQPADASEAFFETKTRADGSFVFPELTLGDWTLWEEVPDGWTSITPSKFDVHLEQASSYPRCVMVRFKNRPPDLCAEGYKLDENGTGLAGWTVVAYPAADPTKTMSATTDAHGYYRFNGLTLGDWIFQVKHQVGWKPITNDSVKIPIVAGCDCTQVPVFRNHSPLGCIDVLKTDNFGVGLPGWNIKVKPVDGGPAQHGWTDGTGLIVFRDLPMGKYEVSEESQPGWAPISPTEIEVKLTPSDEAACAKVPFVNKQVPRDICIDGYKIDKAGKVGLPDWPVTAKNLKTGAVLDTKTDGVGYFLFSNLEPGKYEVTVADEEGWVHVGPASQVVTVKWPPKNECTTLKFYNRQESSPPPPPTDAVEKPAPPDKDKADKDKADKDEVGKAKADKDKADKDEADRDKADKCRAHYTVHRGDQLNRIAAHYDTSIRAIARANGIRNLDKIYAGQKLCIP